nr:helix-turn-helix domain-containing protein [Gloeothece citriformis]
MSNRDTTEQLIDLGLTHQEISEILGATRVTITRVINQLEQQGLIERHPLHRIILKDEEVWHYQI